MAIMPVLSLAAGVIGTAVSALGAFNQAKAQQAQAQYQAEVAANNAKIAGYNAAIAGQKGQADIAAKGAEERARLGAEAAMQGALGTDVESGSNVDTRTSQRMTAITDINTLNHNAALEAYGYQNQSRGYQGQSEADKTAAANAGASAPGAAFGSLLEGVSSLSNKWTTFQNNGALGGSSGGGGTTNGPQTDPANG